MKFMQNMVIMIKLRSNNRCINNNTCLCSKKNGAYFHSNIQKKELAKMRRCIFTICDKLLFSHLQHGFTFCKAISSDLTDTVTNNHKKK